jgi:hypothetical protein
MIQHNQSIKSSKNGYRCDAEPHFAFWHHFFGRVSVVAYHEMLCDKASTLRLAFFPMLMIPAYIGPAVLG